MDEIDKNRTIAVGDIHGDLDALLRILLGLRLVSKNGNWSGGCAILVLLGDLNDRGCDSASVILFVMRLQAQAQQSGGRVESLIGNHEMLAAQGVYRYVRSVEVIAMEQYWFEHQNGLYAFYCGNSPYAKWIRQRPTIYIANKTLFVHAGITRGLLGLTPQRVNELVALWIEFYQGVGTEPDRSTHWLIEDQPESPLWTRQFEVKEKSIDRDCTTHPDRIGNKKIREYCKANEVDRIVIGHCPTKDVGYEIAYPHPRFKDIAVIDTGISEYYNGRLSALVVSEDNVTSHYFDRGNSELALTQELRTKFQSELSMSSMIA